MRTTKNGLQHHSFSLMSLQSDSCVKKNEDFEKLTKKRTRPFLPPESSPLKYACGPNNSDNKLFRIVWERHRYLVSKERREDEIQKKQRKKKKKKKRKKRKKRKKMKRRKERG